MTTTTFVDNSTVVPAAWLNDVDTAAYKTLTSVAGTNTITATGPANATLAAGLAFEFIAAGANTGAVTLNVTPSGGAALGAKSITKFGTTALVTGDIVSGGAYRVIYDGTRFVLLNPGIVPAANTSGLAASGNNTDIISLGAVVRASLAVHNPQFVNGQLSHSRSGNAETIAIKTLAGADPSSTDPVTVVFRSATATTGDYSVITLTAATSITISSGSTLGTTNNVAFRLWVVAFNDAGTLRMGVIKCASTTGIYPLSAWGIASSTAEGGAGAADSSQVFYTGTAVSSKPYTVLGYSTWESGLAAVGTWGTAPTRTHLYGPGTKLPNDRIQIVVNGTAGGLASASTSYVDITNATVSITPTSAANAVLVQARGNISAPYNGAANTGGFAQLLEGSTSIDGAYLHSGTGGATGVGWSGPMNMQGLRFPNSSSAVTYKLQQAGRNAGAGETITTTVCYIHTEELMT